MLEPRIVAAPARLHHLGCSLRLAMWISMCLRYHLSHGLRLGEGLGRRRWLGLTVHPSCRPRRLRYPRKGHDLSHS